MVPSLLTTTRCHSDKPKKKKLISVLQLSRAGSFHLRQIPLSIGTGKMLLLEVSKVT